MGVPKARIRYQRPVVLISKTYKLRRPDGEHAVYVTISDGIIDEETRPVEIFICTKNLTEQLTLYPTARMVSAVLQQPGPFPKFVVEELIETHDAYGGYFIPGGGGKVNSLISHIGLKLKEHCVDLGLMK